MLQQRRYWRVLDRPSTRRLRRRLRKRARNRITTSSDQCRSASSSRAEGGRGLTFADKIARERLRDQLAGFVEPVERDERAEARPALLAEEHGVDHVEEVVRDP